MAKTVRFHEYGGPDVLRVEDAPVGEPGPGEALVRIEAVGLNRAEALFRSGVYIERARSFPARLGAEAAGVIEALGDDTAGFLAGQAVSVIPTFSMNDYGVYAERAVVPVASLIARPDSVDAVEGAAVWMPYLTAYGALAQVGGIRPGDTAVITAASSSVGLAAIQIANRLGAVPIATTRSQSKKDALLKAGAAEVVVTDEEDVTARILDLTGGRGAEFAFDAVAGPGVTALAKAVAPDGILFLYGALSGQPTPYPGFDLGMPALNMRTFLVHETTRDADRLRRAAAFIASGLRDGAFTPTVDRVFALDAIAEAHRHMEGGAQFGKLVAVP
ncbi:zinc-dependent alcohol dehydrogenase family protein [Glycomyces algeriensis]|uniref:NADPH:quinone reductase n=1 Tax=Glycomyces algeriensis TaxID=256037 RepID=A0A9W6GAX6_9ACTN|nr:zinc-dependent alcohol dehydrogenase family protein [Glycomyces algeriensis]MDA1364683.1 zinc-dependent alcohol dehydrogenase family protein [Glycomyces algeriensis]MDR7350723.1 NADPH:quinone reductase-like Zn-dependent oxidoreductase [Glycomyces algeriensis]GLI43434.1 NADPH:quinone reductase [Glycomyces algeriensis]